MKVFVTGGAGYVGSACLRQLLAQGHDAVAFDNLSEGHRLAVPAGRLIEGDIRDTAALTRALKEHGSEAVMHFAAATYVGESVTNPDHHYGNNIGGTLSLLRAMREVGVQRMLFSSTCATYGDNPAPPMNEEAAQIPCSPYARTKLAVEWMIRDFAHAYGLGFTILRYFNASGADRDGEFGENHEPETHLIPLLLQVALGQRDDATRPDVHIRCDQQIGGAEVLGHLALGNEGRTQRYRVPQPELCDLLLERPERHERLAGDDQERTRELGQHSGHGRQQVLDALVRLDHPEEQEEGALRLNSEEPAGLSLLSRRREWEDRSAVRNDVHALGRVGVGVAELTGLLRGVHDERVAEPQQPPVLAVGHVSAGLRQRVVHRVEHAPAPGFERADEQAVERGEQRPLQVEDTRGAATQCPPRAPEPDGVADGLQGLPQQPPPAHERLDPTVEKREEEPVHVIAAGRVHRLEQRRRRDHVDPQSPLPQASAEAIHVVGDEVPRIEHDDSQTAVGGSRGRQRVVGDRQVLPGAPLRRST